MKLLIFSTLLTSTAFAALPSDSEDKLKTSISSSELDEQLRSNIERKAFLKAELSKKVKLLSQIQNGASAPIHIWEEVPANQRNRAALEKILKLAVRRHLDEINRIQQINTEISSQLDWMSHEVSAPKAEVAKVDTKLNETMPREVKPATDSKKLSSSDLAKFSCGDVPVSYASLSSNPILQDFGTRKDSLTGLEWNSLGWWISQKPASAIRACHQGKIVFSGPMQGRGHVIMIDHGDDFLTIYANIAPSSSKFKLGTSVRTGEVIGSSQDSVYFEVRHKGQAVNPRLVFARQNLDILGL
jgi:murein DD-endopeptidase MepM/ murein hydrolase activator NlpD